MEVVVIEAEAFQQLLARIENMEKLFLETVKDFKDKSNERWLTIFEVAELTGFSRAWVYHRKDYIGFFQEGKDLRFWKQDVIKFMNLRSIEPKINKALKTLGKYK
jgi:hypothetical protein